MPKFGGMSMKIGAIEDYVSCSLPHMENLTDVTLKVSALGRSGVLDLAVRTILDGPLSTMEIQLSDSQLITITGKTRKKDLKEGRPCPECYTCPGWSWKHE